MADKMKLCRCLSETKMIFLIFMLLLSVNDVISATTVSTNTTNNATTTIAATTTTTIPPTTTTTLPPTTTIAPNQPRTEIGETVLGQCLCDVTGNACDINCCCDADCTPADIATFVCDAVSKIVDDKKCFQEELFLFTNSPETTRTENGLFCIYFDNYASRNFYLDPDFVQDMSSFNTYLNDFGTASVQHPVSVQEPVYNLNSFYKAGDPVYVVYPNQSSGKFVLPVAFSNSECTDQSPMPYLREMSSTCHRLVTTLDANTCTTTTSFDAKTYFDNFKVVTTPGLFGYVVNGTFVGVTTTTTVAPTTPTTTAQPTTAGNGTNTSTTAQATTTSTAAPTTTTTAPPPTTVNPADIQTLYDNPYVLAINTSARTHLCMQANGSIQNCAFTVPPSPNFTTGTTCNNVVRQVRYFITTNGTSGIANVEVQFVFENIQANDLPLSQTFSISYNTLTDTNNTFERSGNPGYLIGKPVLYGTLVTTANPDGTETQRITIATDPSLGLTVVRASVTGMCNGNDLSRVPLRFGEDMRTGCFIQLDIGTLSNQAGTCDSIQESIIAALEGPNAPEKNGAGTAWVDNNRYVATFGNTAAEKVGDWVKVIASDRPQPGSATATGSDTCRLRMGLHIQVLYANVGALANPQRKIIGVALLYDSAKAVTIRCQGAYCQPSSTNLTQRFEVSQTVSFIDVSKPATMFQGEPPIFIAKLPSDFFYPFLYYTGASSPVNNAQFFPVIFVACIASFISRRSVLFS